MTTTRKFLVNDDASTPQPENSEVVEPEPTGAYLDGRPVYQGWPALQVRWEKMAEASVALLLALYNPADPAVTVQYWDKATQADVTKNAQMQRPVIGPHRFGYYEGVSVRFTRLGAS